MIVKRLPRYDLKSKDPIHIRQSLSEYANSIYDQLWLENGGPRNIHIITLHNMECFGYLKDIIYGKNSDQNYDGIHLRGAAASRHFTYRAVSAIKFALDENRVFTSHASGQQYQRKQQRRLAGNYHDNCKQAQYQGRKQSRSSGGSVHTDTKGGKDRVDGFQVGSTHYTIPVQNRFPENF